MGMALDCQAALDVWSVESTLLDSQMRSDLYSIKFRAHSNEYHTRMTKYRAVSLKLARGVKRKAAKAPWYRTAYRIRINLEPARKVSVHVHQRLTL